MSILNTIDGLKVSNRKQRIIRQIHHLILNSIEVVSINSSSNLNPMNISTECAHEHNHSSNESITTDTDRLDL